MLENFLREYNVNRIFLSNIGLWPFQNRLTRNLLWTFCFLLEISYCPFEVFIDKKKSVISIFVFIVLTIVIISYNIVLVSDRASEIDYIFRKCTQQLKIKNENIIFILQVITQDYMQILLLYDHWDNTQTIFEGLYQMVLSASFLVRIINEFWNRDKIRRLYQTIDEHWNMFTNDVEVRILKDYSTLSRKFTKYYAMLMYVMMSGFIVIPLTPAFLDVIMPVNESRPRFLAIEVEFRVNKDEYFLLIFCYTTAICVVGISIMVSVDAMHITCTAHACSLFEVVSKQVENIISKMDNNNENEYRYLTTELNLSSEEMIYREYITCLKKHQLAIEFVNVLESSYQELSLVLLILVIATLSLIGIRIVYVLNQLEETTRFMFIIMGALMTLMIVCYSGQRLMDESQNVFYRAYAAKWYNFSPRLKSLLLITLYRSNIPCGLKAGNIVPLSIATYATVVRMGMSYFTAFLSLKDK